MTNPYQTPESSFSGSETTQNPSEELASRGARLLAAIIDGIIGAIIAVPFWMMTGAWDVMAKGQTLPLTYMIAGAVYGFIGFALIHYYFLNKNGQTIGKKLLSIRIIGIDDQLCGAIPLLLKRYLPITLVSQIPIVGSLLILIDILFIFRKDRRCVHDLIAGTKVVKYQPQT